jgi:hypothetical protein
MRTRGWLIVIAFSMMGLAGAKTAASVPSTMSASMLAPTDVVANREREISTWTDAGLTEQNVFTNRMLGDNRGERGFADEAASLQVLAAVRRDQGRSEARVPEPATLVFVGTGLIVIAKIRAQKKAGMKFRHVRMRIKATAAQEVGRLLPSSEIQAPENQVRILRSRRSRPFLPRLGHSVTEPGHLLGA